MSKLKKNMVWLSVLVLIFSFIDSGFAQEKFF